MVCVVGLVSPGDSAPLERLPNVTLNLPVQPQVVGYMLTDAFPGVSFNSPLCLVSPPGETNRLFVVEKAGRIQVVNNLAQPTKTLFLDISSRVNAGDEGGLLGLAFHPGYATNRQFFVFYTLDTATGAGTGLHDRVSRFEVSPGDPNSALPDSEVTLISQFDRASNHNAGDLHFGPDGYLYVSLGDEGGGGDPFGNSRKIDHDFFCGIQRLDVDARPGSLSPNPHPAVHTGAGGAANYRIPADNPFIGATSFDGLPVNPGSLRTEFWAVGLRNPWRMSFDPATGLLYCGDVGQSAREEINIIEKGANYGWDYREGTIHYSDTPPVGANLREPILDYARTGTPGDPAFQGECVIGGVVYRGARIPELTGHYVFGDYLSGHIWAFRYDGTNATAFRRLTSFRPVGFGVDPANGDVLIVGGDITIQRLLYSREVVGDPLPPTLADTGAFADLASLTPQPGIVPYSLNVPFWSDHALKSRWFSIPNPADTMSFDASGNWRFPSGTVWIKHFEMEMTNGAPASRRRLETRFLVKNDDGIHGFTYQWNAAQTDADLVPEAGVNEVLDIRNPDGSALRSQTWRYPSRGECLQCHTPQGGYALGFNTGQLNRIHDYGDGSANQIAALSDAGYFANPVTGVHSLPALSRPDETTVSLERRVRSYLQANCASCHQPGGPSQGSWDARIATETAAAGLINGPLVNNLGDPANRVLVPSDTVHSVLLQKMSTRGPGQMPPLASSIADPTGIALLTEWINAGLTTGNLIAPEITWSNPAAIGYGTALGPPQLNAAANVPGTFSYNPPAGTVLNAGSSRTLSVAFTPTDTATYSSAQASVTINVTPAALTITAENKTRTYGAANPTLTASYSGLVNNDTSANLDTATILSTSATSESPVASYAITAAGAADANYTITQVNGTLTVDPAPLIITAENKSKVEGQPNPPLTASYNSFVNGESPASLDNPVVLSTFATTSSPVGSYPITAAGATDANYQISFVAGTLTVEANARFVPLELGQGNRVTISVSGHPNRTYRIQWSPDLDQWNEFAPVTTDGSGVGTYVETADPPPGNRYFRILLP